MYIYIYIVNLYPRVKGFLPNQDPVFSPRCRAYGSSPTHRSWWKNGGKMPAMSWRPSGMSRHP